MGGVEYRSHAHQRNSVSRGIPSSDEFESPVDAGSLIVRLEASNPDIAVSNPRAAPDLKGQFGIVRSVDVRSHCRRCGAVELRRIAEDFVIRKDSRLPKKVRTISELIAQGSLQCASTSG